MAVKFLEDVGAKLINATRKEMVNAIFAASGRVVIGETVTFKQSMIDGVSNIELLKSWGCDMVTINHYNVNFPMIPGMESTQAGIEQFGSCFNEAGSKGCKPSTKVIENSFQKDFLAVWLRRHYWRRQAAGRRTGGYDSGARHRGGRLSSGPGGQ